MLFKWNCIVCNLFTLTFFSLSTLFWRFQIVACINSSFLFIAEQYSTMQVYHSLFTYCGIFSCFQFLTIRYATLNNCIQVFVYIMFSFDTGNFLFEVYFISLSVKQSLSFLVFKLIFPGIQIFSFSFQPTYFCLFELSFLWVPYRSCFFNSFCQSVF